MHRWLLCLFIPSWSFAATELTFCYEDKALPPYYLGDNDRIPSTRPGASIEHLQRLVSQLPATQLPDVTLKLVRLPWKRCLAALTTGQVDALIASYRPERKTLGQYPLLQQQPDPRRAFGEHRTCLVSREDANWHWDGQRFHGLTELVIARPLGYAPLKSTTQQQMTMHYTLSGTMDLDLLAKGRVHAVTTLCEIAGRRLEPAEIRHRQLKVLFPPLHSNTGYLIFSHAFYQQHPAVAEQLWELLAKDKGEDIYLRYLDELGR